MNEQEEVKPAKANPSASSEMLAKAGNINLDAVKNAVSEAGAVGTRLREMLSNFGTIALPKVENPYSKLDFTPPPNPQYETNRLLREVNSKLDNLKEQNAKLVAPNYDPDSCTIIFGNKPIKLKKNTNQAYLCNALFSKPKKKWDWDEMLEHWGERDFPKDDWRKVYEAARSVNEKIAIKTGVQDFLDYDRFSVMLNTNYMP